MTKSRGEVVDLLESSVGRFAEISKNQGVNLILNFLAKSAEGRMEGVRRGSKAWQPREK